MYNIFVLRVTTHNAKEEKNTNKQDKMEDEQVSTSTRIFLTMICMHCSKANTRTHARTHACMHACTHTHTHTTHTHNTHTHTQHTHTHNTHTHTHTHTHTPLSVDTVTQGAGICIVAG